MSECGKKAICDLQSAKANLRNAAQVMSMATTAVASDHKIMPIIAEQLIGFQQKTWELISCIDAHIAIIDEQVNRSKEPTGGAR